MSKIAQALMHLNGILENFICIEQRFVMQEVLRGEEGEWMADTILSIAETVSNMPLPYKTDGQGGKAIAHLHYFKGACDWWITERDSTEEQIQAFGRADLGYGPELGYISIKEMIENGVELDLYWKPKQLRDCR